MRRLAQLLPVAPVPRWLAQHPLAVNDSLAHILVAPNRMAVRLLIECGNWTRRIRDDPQRRMTGQ